MKVGKINNEVITSIARLFDDPGKAKQALTQRYSKDPNFDFGKLLREQTEARKKRDENGYPSPVWILENELDDSPVKATVLGKREATASMDIGYHGRYDT